MKYQKILDQMTLEEKTAILTGKSVWETLDIPRLNVPSLFLSDGPNGVRKQAGASDHLGLNPSLPSTCFPTAATVANSWDPELGEEIGQALGEEAAALDVNVLLGPGLNMKRSPLCGRNFEYFSEDPYLAGKMAAGYIRGIQSQGVAACPKHFAANNQELRRMASNSVVDERTLREVYLTAFEIAVKEGKAKTIMSAYNEINGRYANEDPHLLQEILRDEWGFDGSVITDWGGSNSHTEGVRCGSTLEMPAAGGDSARELMAAVADGTLPMEAVDARVEELLELVFSTSEPVKAAPKVFQREAHHALAKRAAASSVILLKNEDNILPLMQGTHVAVIGDFAETPRYQGAGSSMVNPTQVDATLQCMGASGLDSVGFANGYQRSGKPDAQRRQDALELAKKADVVLLYMGLDEISESEGLDRKHMKMADNQIELLHALHEANARVVVVLSAGSPVEVPWLDDCQALVHGYLGGQAGAGAMLDVITGRVCPSGRLSETYPVRYEDTPAYRFFPGAERTVEYREGPYIGYRYYETAKIPVAFPFGFGLSYTSFAYSDLQVNEAGAEFTLTNTGKADGAEVAQLYVGCPDGRVFRPAKELKGFLKVFLNAGESRRVTIPFDDKTFRYFNKYTNRWEIEEADYEIMVGANVQDIRLNARLNVKGTGADSPYDPEKLPDYYSGKVQNVPDDEFEALLGHAIPDRRWPSVLDRNDSLCEMTRAKSGLARLVCRVLAGRIAASEAKGKPDLNALFIYNIPFRGIGKMANGMVSMEMVDGMVTVVNGHFCRGMGKIIGGFFRNGKANKVLKAKLEHAESENEGEKA